MRNAEHIKIRRVSWLYEAAQLSAIRRRVFIEEQAVPEELELDGEDAGAEHWLGYVDDAAVGTVRLLPDGHIGRMAVLAERRHQGIGSALLSAAVAYARASGMVDIYLHAQIHALPFYAVRGFRAEGDIFMDAGIAHRCMRLR